MAKEFHPNVGDTVRSHFAQDLSDRFIASFNQNHSPFSHLKQLPFNPITGKRFYGANLLSLILTPYSDPRWYSFDAVKEMKGDISGQKGTPCLYWCEKWESVTHPKIDANGQPVLDEHGNRINTTYKKRTMIPKRFIVFNAEQISGVNLLKLSPPKIHANDILDSLINTCPIQVEQGNADIYYPAKDKITIQDIKDPQRPEKTLELLARWSGHASRLNRDIDGLFGGPNDAKEELRAKLALLIFATQVGVSVDPFHQTNQTYFQQWKTLLQKDSCEILRITKDAEVILNFFQSMQSSLAEAMNGRGTLDDVASMYKELNLKNWSGQVLVRAEFVHDDVCETVHDERRATQFSIYAIGQDGRLQFVAKAPTLKEAEHFADKLKALYQDARNDAKQETKATTKSSTQQKEQSPVKEKRFWLGNVFDKDRQKFFEKLERIKKNGGKFDAKYKRWYLPEGVDPEPLKEFWPKKKLNPKQELNVMDAQNDLRQALIDMKFKLSEDDPIMDGQIHRCPLNDDKPGQRGGSYIGYLNEGRGWPYARIENFRTGEVRHWKANGTGRFVSDSEKEHLKIQAEQAKEQRLKELQSQYESVAIECQQAYGQAQCATKPTQYLQHKGINQSEFKQLMNVKLDESGNLMVPLQDTSGKIWSIEKIYSNGFKSLAKGGQKSGHFSVIETAQQQSQGLEKASVILICEGYATGVSLALTLKQPVVMAVDAGNLPSVAKALKEKYPDKAFVICGDDDRDNKVNKGREKALEAADAIGAEVVFPVFAEDEKGKEFTDFNDLATKSRFGKLGVEQQVGSVIERVINNQFVENDTKKQTVSRKM